MAVANLDNIVAFLQDNGFLTPQQLQQLRKIGGAIFADPRAFVRELVQRDWLTPYQANQLLLGRQESLLLGSYRILDRLGEGGMGLVFKAHHVSMDRIVALKVIPKDRISDPVALQRFLREVKAVAKLSHPNIVTAFEVNQVGQAPFLAMEHVDGIDLAHLVQQSGPLPIANSCEYIRQAALGLQHAHEKGLVHRDIKPGNLMVARPYPDVPAVIKILDFGLARFESESGQSTRITQLGKVVGTVDYIAPEQTQDARIADIRADIYSLGCSLFYLLTGQPPFPGDDMTERIRARMLGDAPSVRALRAEVSGALDRVLAKMMERDPAKRYQTPKEVAKALEPFIEADGKTASALSNAIMPATRPQKGKVKPPSTASMSAAVNWDTIVDGRAAPGKLDPLAGRGTPKIKNRIHPLRTRMLPLQPLHVKLLAAALCVVLISLLLWAAGAFKPGSSVQREGSMAAPKHLEIDLGGVKLKTVRIEPGKFMMGSPLGEDNRRTDEFQHEVEITKPFYMGVYLVTQSQYRFVMGKNPSSFSAQGDRKEEEFPVESVSWIDAQAFCRKLTSLEEMRSKGLVCELPTEAEWEYACRAGTKTTYWFGETISPDQANYKNKIGRTTKVGSYPANAWGLYDMHGNVWEWCNDGYDNDYYANSPRQDPTGPQSGIFQRVLRGGSWISDPWYCRTAFRSSSAAVYSVGFRVVLRAHARVS